MPTQIPITFIKIDVLIPKFIWKRKEPRLAKRMKKNKAGGLRALKIKICQKAT